MIYSEPAWSTPVTYFAPPTTVVAATSVGTGPAVSLRDIQQNEKAYQERKDEFKTVPRSLVEIQEQEKKAEQALAEEMQFQRWWAEEEARVAVENARVNGLPMGGERGGRGGRGGRGRGRGRGRGGGAAEGGDRPVNTTPKKEKPPRQPGQGGEAKGPGQAPNPNPGQNKRKNDSKPKAPNGAPQSQAPGSVPGSVQA